MKFFGGVLSASCLWVLLAGETVLGQNSISESGPALNALPAAARVATELDRGVRPRHFYENLYEGAQMSFQLWDVAGLAASAFLNYQKPAQGFKLPPFEVDEEISESLARIDGRKSLGALSPVYYPGATATARLAGMVMIDAVGIHDYSPATYAKMFRFHQALYYTNVVTHLAKRNIQRSRPDGSDTYSFFSGHTSAAFATSTFLYLEARDFIDALAERHSGRLPLFSPHGWKRVSFGVLYGWAGYVGYSRIHDKKHYLSDVLAGAASGTLVSYLVYPHQLKSDKIQMGIQPMRGGAALGMRVDF